MAIPGIFPRIRRESAAIPIPHVVTRCARGGTDGRICSAGWGTAEDGNVWVAALQPRTLSAAVALQRTVDRRFGPDWNRLRRAGGDGTAEHEEGDRVFVRQSLGF